MSSVDRFKYFLKVAAYSVPDDDMYAAGSVSRHSRDIVDKATSQKNMGALAAGALGVAATHKLSKPFSDKKIPLSQQKFRSAAMLGAGLFAAKKARDFLGKRDKASQKNVDRYRRAVL